MEFRTFINAKRRVPAGRRTRFGNYLASKGRRTQGAYCARV